VSTNTGSTKKLLIDSREPPAFTEKVLAISPIPVEFVCLKTGDYCMDLGTPDEITIERKTGADFCSSIIDKRIFKQAKRLQKLPHPLIIISGGYKNPWIKVTPHAIIGTKAFLAAKGITLIDVDSDEEMVFCILKIFEHFGKLKLILPAQTYKKPKKKLKPKS